MSGRSVGEVWATDSARRVLLFGCALRLCWPALEFLELFLLLSRSRVTTRAFDRLSGREKVHSLTGIFACSDSVVTDMVSAAAAGL